MTENFGECNFMTRRSICWDPSCRPDNEKESLRLETYRYRRMNYYIYKQIKVLRNALIVLNAVALYHAVLFYSQDDNGRLSGEFHTTRDMHAYSRQCFGGKREEIMEDKTRERPVAGWCYSWWLQELYWHFPHQSSNKVWDFLCPHDPLVVLPQGLNFVEHR